MKLKNMVICLLLCYTFTACIQKEALNSEADIETCTLNGDVLSRAPIIENNEIILMVKPESDITKLAPKFTLTDGATIEPKSGTERNFEKSQAYSYVVTSQDGKWSKEYIVKVFLAYINTDYHFENYRLNHTGNYYIFYEKSAAGDEVMTWASGNEGFAIANSTADKSQYPTTIDKIGKYGDCAKLQTKETGPFGLQMGMPMAAGNLFAGSFQLNITDVLRATEFGVPFYFVPTHFKGFYKYKAGEMFKVLGKNSDGKNILVDVPSKKDICNIYAVFYETDENFHTLTGHNVNDNTDLHIIARADIPDARESDEWLEFNIPFELLPGRAIDKEKLKAGKYNLAIIFSSSKNGDQFEGAPNSTLWIDEVEIDYEGKK